MLKGISDIAFNLLPNVTYSLLVRIVAAPFLLSTSHARRDWLLKQGFRDAELLKALEHKVIVYDCRDRGNLTKIENDYSRWKSCAAGNHIFLVQTSLTSGERRRIFGIQNQSGVVFLKGELRLITCCLILITVILTFLTGIYYGAVDAKTLAWSLIGFTISSLFVKGVENNILESSLNQSNAQVIESLLRLEPEISSLLVLVEAGGVENESDIIHRCSFLGDINIYLREMSSDSMIHQKCDYLSGKIKRIREKVIPVDEDSFGFDDVE